MRESVFSPYVSVIMKRRVLWIISFFSALLQAKRHLQVEEYPSQHIEEVISQDGADMNFSEDVTINFNISV